MNTSPVSPRRATIVVAIAVSLSVAGCASAASRPPVQPEPVACADASIVELRAEHPDSLPARAWHKLPALERDCSLAGAAAAREPRRMGHHNAWWMGSGLVMALMMLAMWIP